MLYSKRKAAATSEPRVFLGGQRGGGGRERREFSFLGALWMKLFVSLVERAQLLLYVLPEGRRLKRLCAGRLAPLIMVAFSGEAGVVLHSMCLAGRGVGHQ